MHQRLLSLALPCLLVLSQPLAAQTQTQTTDHSAHAGHAGHAPASPAEQAFAEINTKMHAAMNIAFTGNPDADFILGMIPHHEGAVAMARVVLEHGSDPEVKALAEAIIAAQETEIAWMKDWLARNGH